MATIKELLSGYSVPGSWEELSPEQQGVWEQISKEEQDWIRGRLEDLPFGVGEQFRAVLPALPGEEEGGDGAPGDYPTLELPRYEPFGAPYPTRELPIYDPFKIPYPELQLPEPYTPFGEEYPKLGALYGDVEDIIGKFLSGEITEELMESYIAQEELAMEKYMPELREYWSAKGLLRSGMEREAERKSVVEAAVARGGYQAELNKDALVTGLNLAMEHIGMGYEAQKDAWEAARNEYEKTYQYGVAQGMTEYAAATDAWKAALSEYVKHFSSKTGAVQFSQGIAEKAYDAARGEYTKVYTSAMEGGLQEWEAVARAWDAAQSAFQFGETMEFNTWLAELQAEVQLKCAEMGLDAQQTSNVWGFLGTIIGGALTGPIGGVIGGWMGSWFD